MFKMIKSYVWDVFVNKFFASYIVPYKIREYMYRLLGIKMGKKSAIHAKCYVSGNNITIGNHSYLNKECVIDACYGRIFIGNNVGIAYRCQLLTTNHDYSDGNKRTGKVFGADIVIEDGCWIGAGTIILPGVTIKNGVMVAAGSVVTKDCEENCLYAGNPARKIKELQ